MLCDRPYVNTFAGFNTVFTFNFCKVYLAALINRFFAAPKLRNQPRVGILILLNILNRANLDMVSRLEFYSMGCDRDVNAYYWPEYQKVESGSWKFQNYDTNGEEALKSGHNQMSLCQPTCIPRGVNPIALLDACT